MNASPTGGIDRHRRQEIAVLLALVLVLVPVLATATPVSAADRSPLTPPASVVLTEARTLVQAMKQNLRGPYLRIRWFCNDGTVLPPVSYACRPHGGGIQHAEYSPARHRLAELGWSVGTIFASLGWDEFLDADRRNQRMRELVLERYLVDTDDGWVLRKARTYRGRVQVEDEEEAGRKLLTRLLADPVWVDREFLLARELVRTLPHHGGGDPTREVRRLALEIAEAAPSFEPIRILIHTTPSAGDLARTRTWLGQQTNTGLAPEVLAKARSLVTELDRLYGPERDWLGQGIRRLRGAPEHRAWAEALRPLARTRGMERVALLAGSLSAARDLVASNSDGDANLAVMDLGLEVERELLLAARSELGDPQRSWRRMLELARHLVSAGRATGFYSARETAALVEPVVRLLRPGERPAAEVAATVGALARASAWGLGTVRHTFAEPLVRYQALEPSSGRFVDDVLRGSPLLPLSDAVATLTLALDRRSGRVHRIMGRDVHGVVVLNPGVGTGTLRWADLDASDAPLHLNRDDIAVLPRTVSDLRPVAGILSLAEGNLLSHVQLLARNLGIPNAFVTPEVATLLKTHEGSRVRMAVSRSGSLLVDAAPVRESAPSASPTTTSQAGEVLSAPEPDLSAIAPIPLSDLHAGLAGKVVGPKAANLGELARLFPGRVAPALALPFGFFHKATTQGPNSPRARIDAAYQSVREGRMVPEALAPELESIRTDLAGLVLPAAIRTRLAELMHEHFGPPGSWGVFVRSDTNVEDLPGFTGAGLNETLPNLPSAEAAIAVVPRVWSSVLSPRSLAWRASILDRPERIFSSILLMKSVPSDRSGVMVTRDLVGSGPGLTVSAAFGVGGAVDGEAAETVVLRPDGSVLLAAEAKSAWQRKLAASGGVEWKPAPAGRVLSDDDHRKLRELAAEVEARMRPTLDAAGMPLPWDIEFGFVGEDLVLFQIRPLVERGQGAADRLVAEALGPGTTGEALLRLDDPLLPASKEPNR